MGFLELLLLAIGCACGLLVRLLLRNNIMTALLLCIGALITHGLSDWFLNVALLQLEGTFVFLWRITLPNVLYTLLLCPIIYGIFAWLEKRLKKYN